MSVGLLVFIVAEIKNSQKLVKTALNINWGRFGRESGDTCTTSYAARICIWTLLCSPILTDLPTHHVKNDSPIISTLIKTNAHKIKLIKL